MIDIKDDDIIARLRNFEDNFVERKTSRDTKGWLNTTVAFANSVPEGYPGILFIGVNNDGDIEGTANFESLQKSYNAVIGAAYPPIYALPKVLSHEGKQFLAVLVPGSPDRPHFAGKAYVRNGPESKEASEEQFTALIASRNSKANEILKWKGKPIFVDLMNVDRLYERGPVDKSLADVQILDCTQFYVTLGFPQGVNSYPLSRVDISFAHTRDRLKLEVYPIR